MALSDKDGNVMPDIRWNNPVHNWFELSYAHWLTLPRVLMQEMPGDWCIRMARCLNEFDAEYNWRPKNGRFWVSFRDDSGRYAPLPSYGGYRYPDWNLLDSLRKPKPDPEPEQEVDRDRLDKGDG